jgi:ferredoxin
VVGQRDPGTGVFSARAESCPATLTNRGLLGGVPAALHAGAYRLMIRPDNLLQCAACFPLGKSSSFIVRCVAVSHPAHCNACVAACPIAD